MGDSNVIRYLPLLKEKKSDPAIQSVVLARATNAVTLQDALSHPKSAHTTVIISAITNLLTAKYFDDFDDMTAHCKTVSTTSYFGFRRDVRPWTASLNR